MERSLFPGTISIMSLHEMIDGVYLSNTELIVRLVSPRLLSRKAQGRKKFWSERNGMTAASKRLTWMAVTFLNGKMDKVPDRLSLFK